MLDTRAGCEGRCPPNRGRDSSIDLKEKLVMQPPSLELLPNTAPGDRRGALWLTRRAEMREPSTRDRRVLLSASHWRGSGRDRARWCQRQTKAPSVVGIRLSVVGTPCSTLARLIRDTATSSKRFRWWTPPPRHAIRDAGRPTRSRTTRRVVRQAQRRVRGRSIARDSDIDSPFPRVLSA